MRIEEGKEKEEKKKKSENYAVTVAVLTTFL
jgi:hypothetical protein